MQSLAFELEAIVDQRTPALLAMPDDKMKYKPSLLKWSKKEILGHMVDSAQNNIRRFIVSQYEDNPVIVYRQDEWVSISHYQDYNLPDLVNLWNLLNKHIAFVWRNLPPEKIQRCCQTEALYTIDWLAHDYVKHLRHHLHQVLELEPVVYP